MPRGTAETTTGDFTRRDFLRAASALTLVGSARATPNHDTRAVILLLLVGGPSQLDSFDPKPDAPAEVRGPFRSIATRTPGLRLCEHLPRLADRLDRVALIRGVHHDQAPIHETGLQILQAGAVAGPGEVAVPIGLRAARMVGSRGDGPGWAILPGRLDSTGVAIGQGQEVPDGPPVDSPFRSNPGELDRLVQAEPPRVRETYGDSDFGRSCLAARRLIEQGARLVTVNMYPGVFGVPGWDVHGGAPFSTFDDYATKVLPTFDHVFDALLTDLERSGRLDQTLVIASGEFGRSPRVNSRGGRDHWPAVWTALAAGGGVAGGVSIGSSDRLGCEPYDRPVPLAELSRLLAREVGLVEVGPQSLPELFA